MNIVSAVWKMSSICGEEEEEDIICIFIKCVSHGETSPLHLISNGAF